MSKSKSSASELASESADSAKDAAPSSVPEGPLSEEPAAAEAPASEAPASYRSVASPKKKKKKHAETAVRLNNVTKRFGQNTAVNGVSVRIRGGSVYGLIGPNGAGKTTIFSMLAGYLRPTEGNLEVLGFAPTNVPVLRGRLGVLPQDALLPASDKVGEFLIHMGRLQNLSAAEAEKEAREALEEVEGKDWWNQRCGTLSHGMAKRVGIAQAFLGDPEVVLLDEPTAGLDPRVAYEVRQIIRARRGRATLIVSSHNLQELEEICDGAAILDRGRLVANGSISELTASSEEIHIKIAPGPLPLAKVIELSSVKHAEFIEESRDLIIYFERKNVDAESVIGQVLWVLLQDRVMISGLTKGRGLEKRVIDLTDNQGASE